MLDSHPTAPKASFQTESPSEPRARIIQVSRGFQGWNIHGIYPGSGPGDRCTIRTSAGYGGSAEDALRENPEFEYEGAYIFDAAHLEQDPQGNEAFARFVIRGPVVDPHLPANTIQNVLGPLVAFNAAESKVSSFTSVSIDVYAQLAKKAVPGIKIGRVSDNAVHWDS